MPEFDPKLKFRPKGNALKFWTLLPQVSSNSNNPPLFGKIKGIVIYYIMIGALLFMEGVLAYTLNEEGLNFMTFLALSIADFVLVILPALFHLNPNYNSAIINANIFIYTQKLRIDNKRPETTQTKESYIMDLKKDLNKWKSNRTVNTIINIFVFVAIVGLSVWKFISFYNVLGNDIFVESIGRFILIGLIISVLVHAFCTKIVFYHLFYKSSFNKQLKDFENSGGEDYKILKHETNKQYNLTFNLSYNPVASNNQRVCEEILDNEINNPESKSNIIALNNGDRDVHYRIDKIVNRDNARLVYTGLLTDSELTSLSQGQSNSDSRIAIIVSGKEIQLGQIISE